MLLKSFFYPKIKRNINNNNEEIQLLEIKIIPIDENTNNNINISPSNINQPIKSPYHDNQKEYSFEICDTV
jgi:translation initiation factor 2 gamma subunit (eIF-2gamma)